MLDLSQVICIRLRMTLKENKILKVLGIKVGLSSYAEWVTNFWSKV